jgi:disulfide bond formation protein DsbB
MCICTIIKIIFGIFLGIVLLLILIGIIFGVKDEPTQTPHQQLMDLFNRRKDEFL